MRRPSKSVRRFLACALGWIAGYCILDGSTLLVAQQARDSREVLRLKDHPLNPDRTLGAPAARFGEGRFRQVDVTLIEIPPGGKLAPHRHLAEEMIYVVSGKGYSLLWAGSESRKERYEWAEGDLLSPSLNAWHQHVNSSSTAPARVLSITTAPLTQNVFKNAAFLSASNFLFEERWKKSVAQKPQYTPDNTDGPEIVRMQVGHLLSNLRNREMRDRGQNMLGITITPDGDMAGNSLLEMEVREFTTGNATTPEHRHLWETVYYVLKGEGFAVLQRDGEPERRLDWTEGDMFLVEANEYHNHRPKGTPGARFLQIKASGYFRRVGIDNYLMQDKPK